MTTSELSYLNAIRALQNEKIKVRSVDVATILGVSRASVSIALKKLREKGLTAKLKGASIKGFKYKIGMKVWIEIVSAANCTPQTLVFNYDVISTKDVFWDYLGFWNRDYAFKRI